MRLLPKTGVWTVAKVSACVCSTLCHEAERYGSRSLPQGMLVTQWLIGKQRQIADTPVFRRTFMGFIDRPNCRGIKAFDCSILMSQFSMSCVCVVFLCSLASRQMINWSFNHKSCFILWKVRIYYMLLWFVSDYILNKIRSWIKPKCQWKGRIYLKTVLKKFPFIFYVRVRAWMPDYHLVAAPPGGQKMVLGPLGQELQRIVSW